jgi:L-methionine (R)-S-oxide reductase
MSCEAGSLLKILGEVALQGGDRDALGQALVAGLKDAFPQASWVGIYWLQGQELVLGPYLGPPTEHDRIPIGVGVCGTAVAEDEDQVVDDVRKRANYLACSSTVRSEIVVLIRAGGRVVGQLDLDSEKVGGFSGDDHCVLKAVADSFGGLLASLPDAHVRPA